METYIALLRGINVSGQKMIPMDGLKTLFGKLGFTEVTSFIQSGNLIFQEKKAEDSLTLSKRIHKAIQKSYGFEVPVQIRTRDQLREIIQTNPFLKARGIDPKKLHTTFLAQVPDSEKRDALQKIRFDADQFRITGSEVYLYCPLGYGNSKVTNAFFENKLGVQATTRNWNTVQSLYRLANPKI